jgi:hypothetical protein
LNEQINLEDPSLLDAPSEPMKFPIPSPTEAFSHWLGLYIKYIQIFRKLEDCYDSMVHPQKRIEIKRALEVVMARVVELKHRLVHWNTPNPDVRDGFPFPWEYINFDEALFDLKLSPDVLELPIPRYFEEKAEGLLQERERLIQSYTIKHHGIEKVMLEPDDRDSDGSGMTIEVCPFELLLSLSFFHHRKIIILHGVSSHVCCLTFYMHRMPFQ